MSLENQYLVEDIMKSNGYSILDYRWLLFIGIDDYFKILKIQTTKGIQEFFSKQDGECAKLPKHEGEFKGCSYLIYTRTNRTHKLDVYLERDGTIYSAELEQLKHNAPLESNK